MTYTLPTSPAAFEAAATVASRGFGSAGWASLAATAAAACAATLLASVPVLASLSASREPAGMATPRETPSAAERALPATVPEGAGKARIRSRCQGCGVVESIRRVEPVGNEPAGYEFTIRLRDGSTRVTSDATPAQWRIGDSIMLIGGARIPAQ